MTDKIIHPTIPKIIKKGIVENLNNYILMMTQVTSNDNTILNIEGGVFIL